MTGRIDTERILDAFLAPESDRLPDRVLDAALDEIARSPQRRALRAPRRFPLMPALSRATSVMAAVLVVAIGAGVLVLLNSPGDSGARPTPSPTTAPTVAPTAAAPSVRPTTYVSGALTQTFTSDFHGISLNYPEGWEARAAEEPWPGEHPPNWSDATQSDILHDAALEEHLFLTVVSRPLDGASLDEWFAELLGDEACELRAGGTINGADLVLRSKCVNDVAAASSGGRGYYFELRASPDEVELETLDTAALLDSILATVKLQPEDAADE